MAKQLLILLAVCVSVTLSAQGHLKNGHVQSTQIQPSEAAALIDDVSVPAATPVSSRMGGEEVQLGSSYNIYSILLDAQNQVYYHPDLDALTFIHRQNNGEDGGSGIISYDVSFDGGETWDAMNKQITPTLDLSGDGSYIGNGNRYPSGTIYNPPGNTDPANAYFVGAGPALHTDPVFGNGWGWEYVASSKLQFEAGSVVENYYTNADTTSFHPFSIVSNPDGSLWYVSSQWDTDADPDAASTASYGKMFLCRLDFNGTGFDRTIVETFEPNWGVLGDSLWQIQGDYNLAFSPDGMTGYLCYVTTDVDNEGYGEGIGMKPVLWKTTDGGENWTKYAQVNYQEMPELLAETYYTDSNGDGNNNDDSGPILPYMNSIDMVVDGMGDLHIFAEMNSRSQTTIDSIGFGYFNADSVSTLFHFITDGVAWDAKFVDVLACENGAVGSVAVGHRPQASRSPDGMAVFATYLQSWDGTFTGFDDMNNGPDVFAYGYHLESGQSAKKWLTDPFGEDDLSLTRSYFYTTMSPVCIQGGTEKDYELPIAFAQPGSDDLQPVQYWYAKGLGFNEEDLGLNSSVEEVSAEIGFTLAPNPASGMVWLRYDLPETAEVEVVLTDVLGKQIKLVSRGQLSAGEQVEPMNIDGLASGLYFVQLRFGDKIATQKLQVK